MPPRKPKPSEGPPRRDSNGYYTLPDGQRCMSVTTIIENGVPKPELMHWAAKMAARCAVDHLPKLSRIRGSAAREEIFDWLRRAAERKRDSAAQHGSTIHDYVEATILGEPFPEPTDEQRPYMDAYARFVVDYRPEFESTELVVAHPEDEWAGKLDWLGVLKRRGPAMLLGDWKTGSSVYADACLQLSAYRRAKLGWTKKGEQVELPPIDAAVIIHLRPESYPDRGYRLYTADTSDEVYQAFLAARDVALRWVKGAKLTALGEAEELDESEGEVA